MWENRDDDEGVIKPTIALIKMIFEAPSGPVLVLKLITLSYMVYSAIAAFEKIGNIELSCLRLILYGLGCIGLFCTFLCIVSAMGKDQP
ncbi:MAG: hypothetical protein IMZ61_05485 [Planctomycetes bacterium]|nr:hypothetical protein [Planctomycetota bacterium]